MNKLTRTQMLAAMMQRDRRYDGEFFVCVRTTRIYCLPSCKARKPKPENVEFKFTRLEALRAGFRGCKRCRAAAFPDVLPSWIDKIVEAMRGDLAQRLTERDLARIGGVDSSTVRRAFREVFATTPAAYYRRLRLERARELMRSGSSYLQAAFACGWNSASGFREAFIKEFGITPGRISRER